MRQLKFRIWDNEQKKFEYFELHNITVPDRLLTQDKFPVQQFTGLKDKNEKEIYEGDRVTYKLDNNYFYSEIKWKDYTWFIGQLSVSDLFKFDQLKLLEIEIIGNIFQLPCNPDHNGECLVCDCWLCDCQFLSKE
jgi:uncharacterized phage protein (TIGR01671 family)